MESKLAGRPYIIIIVSFLVWSGALALAVGAQTNRTSEQKGKGDRPLKIIKKEPIGSVFGRCRDLDKGLFVSLRVEFLDTGKIGEVSITRVSGCDYFDTEAIKAARRIKFSPQVKAGEPVTTTRRVDYSVSGF